jgi:hypothetical protein
VLKDILKVPTIPSLKAKGSNVPVIYHPTIDKRYTHAEIKKLKGGVRG